MAESLASSHEFLMLGEGVFIYNQRRDRLPSSLSLARTRGDEKGEGQCGGGITPNSRNSRY